MNLIGSGKLSPASLVDTLVEAHPRHLDLLPFGPMVLVVRVPEEDEAGHFMNELSRCALKDAPARSSQSGWVATSEFPTVPAGEQEPNEADQIELLSELMEAPHCLVPLKGSQRAIEIGRAPGLDVVLADPSVSAHHARMLVGDGGTRILDLESKNGTSVNNHRLQPSEDIWLQSMDRLSFGRIQAFVCDPRALRGVLRQSVRIAF